MYVQKKGLLILVLELCACANKMLLEVLISVLTADYVELPASTACRPLSTLDGATDTRVPSRQILDMSFSCGRSESRPIACRAGYASKTESVLNQDPQRVAARRLLGGEQVMNAVFLFFFFCFSVAQIISFSRYRVCCLGCDRLMCEMC